MMLLSAMLLAGATAQGAETPGSRKDAELAMAAFARCEVTSAKGRAAALAYTREVEGTPSDYRERLIKSPCAPRGTSMRFNPALFRMALFPALYAREYGKAAPVDLSGAPVADLAREFDGTPSDQTLVLRNFGNCVVRRDTAGARALVLRKPYSQAEAAALATLQPALGQCVASGQQLRFSRSVVHGALGEALYKLTAATAATKAS